MGVEELVESLVGEISGFGRSWLEKCDAAPKEITERFDYLVSVGYSKRSIARHPHALSYQLEDLQTRHQGVLDLGFPPEMAAKNLALLTRDSSLVKERYENLKSYGFPDRKIRSYSNLLTLSPQKIAYRIANLERLGIERRRIHVHPYLLALTPARIMQNHEWLSNMGVSTKNINYQPPLLGMSLDKLKANHQYLKLLGFKDKSLAARPDVLTAPIEKLRYNYNYMRRIGLSKAVITTHPSLLKRNQESLKKHLDRLLGLDLTQKDIARHGFLLGRDSRVLAEHKSALEKALEVATIPGSLIGGNPDTVIAKKKLLEKLGYDKQRIGKNLHLLALSPDTLTNRHRHHYVALGGGPRAKKLLHDHPGALSIKESIFDANIDYLYRLGITYETAIFFDTKVQTKRRKMAWLLKNVYDYSSEPSRDKILGLHALLRAEPKLLIRGEKYYAKHLPLLRAKAAKYMR